MTRNPHIVEELQTLSPELARIQVVHPYRVPAGYFETLPEQIMRRIRAEEATTAEDELKSLSPLLGGLSKKMPYSVPAGYFESLPVNIPVKEEKQERAKVISFSASKFFRYAAAAVTVGFITLVAWFFIKDSQSDTTGMAANVPNQTPEQVQPKIESISDSEIADFISGTALYTQETSLSTGELGEEDMKWMLAEVSDQELESYLELNNPSKEKFN